MVPFSMQSEIMRAAAAAVSIRSAKEPGISVPLHEDIFDPLIDAHCMALFNKRVDEISPKDNQFGQQSLYVQTIKDGTQSQFYTSQ
jgi:hypothetical protein